MTNYQWAVIGAGPAGIATVGNLIDHGIAPNEIVWIDPVFQVGDFGTLWRNVPSNTGVKLFIKFLQASPAFSYQDCPHEFALHQADPNKTCALNLMVEPLQWVTEQLKQKVNVIYSMAENMTLKHRRWHIQLKHGEVSANNAVLAVGAEAQTLYYPTLSVVPLHDAMDAQNIQHHINKQDTIAVFGSSHSAILVLRNLVETGAHRIINFYRSPLRYAVYLKDWILFDDTGLKGTTAEWARKHLDGDLPASLERIYSNEENIEHYLPQCNKVIYAVGFKRRLLPTVKELGQMEYIEQCGIIAPGLFGVGIAFPEAKYNPIGVLEHRVGLWKFMDYLQRVMPLWLSYST